MTHSPNFRTRLRFATPLLTAAFYVLTLPALVLAQGEIQGDPKNASDNPTTKAAPIVIDAGTAGAEGVVGVLPKVRLTPRDISVQGLDDSRIDLGGEWDFVRDVPENFDGTAKSIPEWDAMTVPGHPALQGYEKMHKEMGIPFAYHRSFIVPAHWDGRRVVLRFEGIDGLTKLYINGQPAGENEIATLPSEFDITDFVKPGEQNELVLTIEKTLTTYWSRRELGGINRPVYLQALPGVNLARVHVDTELSDDLTHATLNAHLRIANQSGQTCGEATVKFTLKDDQGNDVPLKLMDEPILLAGIPDGQTLEVKIPMPVIDTPRLWTAETPNLYTLTCELTADGEPVMSANQRFGFREVTVQGHQITVNGSPVKLRGTNFHITYPGKGEVVPTDLIRKDIALFKEANFNCLRSRPTPSYDYVELCDEMGIYTTVEAMVSIMMYDKGPLGDHGNNPTMAAAYRHHVATMIESYYSNPSVLTWGLGNECSYWDYFKVAALGMHARDTTRPLFFGSDGRQGVDIPLMDINDDHYPRGPYSSKKPNVPLDIDNLVPVTDPGWDYPSDRPNIFTEWLHVHTNNWKEIAFDPGVDDFWGYYAQVHMEHLQKVPHFAGGFHFKGAPYRGIGASERWRGVFDGERRINDIFWHVKKSHTPVRIPNHVGQPDGDELVFEIENRYDFTNLNELTFAWTQGDSTGEARPDVAPQSIGELRIPADPDTNRSIMLDVRTADGDLVDRYELLTREDDLQVTESAAPPAPYTIERTDDTITLTRGNAVIDVNAKSGLIESATIADKPVINGPVGLAVVPAQLRNFKWQKELSLVNQCADWQADSVEVDESGDTVRITSHGKYTHTDVTFVTTFSPDGHIEVAYDATWTGETEFNVFTYGVQVPVAPANNQLFWNRNTLWSHYPDDHIGRATGVALATGDPKLADLRESHTDGPKPWPWSQDLVFGVTNDFRSSKFNLIRGGLIADNGAGIEVIAQGRQHLHASPAGDDLGGENTVKELHGEPTPGFDLRIHDYHNGGTEPHLAKSIRYDEHMAKPGWSITGKAVFRIIPPK